MSKKKYPKIGLALGSGGAKGLAHIGVIKMLEEHNIPIDYIAGASIGAMIGANYAAHKDIQKLEEMILGFNRKLGFQLFDPTWKGGLIKGKKTEHFIAETLDGATFDNLKIPFVAVATDLNTAESVIFTKGNLVKAIRVSISVPAFFQPVIYENRLLADGGLSNPVPVDIVRKMGADIVIAVNLDNVYIEKAYETMPPLSKMPMHSINILRHNLALHSAKSADIVISPKDVMQVGLLGWNHFFITEKAQGIINSGEEEAKESLPLIHELIAYKLRQQTNKGKLLSFIRRLRNF